MKNPKLNERVKSKQGMKDEGNIIDLNPDGTVKVRWHYQDGSEIDPKVKIASLERVKPTVCEKCGRPL